MTAEEIRRFNGFSNGGTNSEQNFWMQEIAAQLAELNQTINRIYPPPVPRSGDNLPPLDHSETRR